MNQKTKIVGICGSLRKGSYNQGALRAARELVPTEATIEILDISQIPLFNADDEVAIPAVVAEFKTKIKEADAVLLVTPEYNYSVPGVLKNANDWASIPYGNSAWDGKPAAIMGVSTGMIGTARVQYHLRQIMVFLNMYPLNRPEVMIANAKEKFDENGNLIDQETKDRIKALLEALVDWTKKLKR